MLDLTLAFDLLVATLVGLAVGTERELSGHTHGPDGRFGGIRTFALLGAIGGFAGWFLRTDQHLAGALVMAGSLAFVVAAYVMAMLRPGTSSDSTTEVVAILVVALGVASGLGFRAAASGAAAVTVLLLAEKSRFQRALTRVAPNEMRAAFHFAVLALVILPLIPGGAFGPYDAFQPRQLWIVVLIFSALNFAGYIARRIIGEAYGLAVTGLLGGLVSSTAVTLVFSRRSNIDGKKVPANNRHADETTVGTSTRRSAGVPGDPVALPLAIGVVAACTVLVPRVVIISILLQPTVGVAAMAVLAPAFLVGVGLIALGLWQQHKGHPTTDAGGNRIEAGLGENPLGLWSSLQMAAAFQLVLFAVAWIQHTAGEPGILASATLLGLTNVDALTLTMARYGSDARYVHTAAVAVGIGVLSNTMLKLTIAMALGTGRYRWYVAGGLLLLAAATGLGVVRTW